MVVRNEPSLIWISLFCEKSFWLQWIQIVRTCLWMHVEHDDLKFFEFSGCAVEIVVTGSRNDIDEFVKLMICREESGLCCWHWMRCHCTLYGLFGLEPISVPESCGKISDCGRILIKSSFNAERGLVLGLAIWEVEEFRLWGFWLWGFTLFHWMNARVLVFWISSSFSSPLSLSVSLV